MQFFTVTLLTLASTALAAPFAMPLDASTQVAQATDAVNSEAVDAAGPRGRGRGNNNRGGGDNQWGRQFLAGLTHPGWGGSSFASTFGSILSGSLLSLGEGAIAGAVGAAADAAAPPVVVAAPAPYYPDPSYAYPAAPVPAYGAAPAYPNAPAYIASPYLTTTSSY